MGQLQTHPCGGETLYPYLIGGGSHLCVVYLFSIRCINCSPGGERHRQRFFQNPPFFVKVGLWIHPERTLSYLCFWQTVLRPIRPIRPRKKQPSEVFCPHLPSQRHFSCYPDSFFFFFSLPGQNDPGQNDCGRHFDMSQQVKHRCNWYHYW